MKLIFRRMRAISIARHSDLTLRATPVSPAKINNMSAKFTIETDGVTFTDKSRAALKEQFGALPPGKYDVLITPAKDNYTATRYKYYWDSVLWQILCEAGHHHRSIDPKTGEETHPKNTADLHEIMRVFYYPVMVARGEVIKVVGKSTTELTDQQFLKGYLQNILVEYSGPPYNIEFISYEDWKELHRANAWINFKQTYKPQQ